MSKCMKKIRWFWLASCIGLLAAMLLAASPPAVHAVAHIPASGACPDPSYGVSYDADTVDSIGSIPTSYFHFSTSNGPSIGIYACANPFYVELRVIGTPLSLTNWYNLTTTVNGQATGSIYNPEGYEPLGNNQVSWVKSLSLQWHTHYTFQIQHCTSIGMNAYCSAWSPQLEYTTYVNHQCMSGYVWRQANPFDQVCVTPAEQFQVSYDNTLAPYRVDPNGAYGPHTCTYGFVWRQAFGGDYTCVIPAERAQAAQDNSLAAYRVLAP